MNQTFKRSASFLLALVMIFSMFPTFGIHAHAEEGEEAATAQYTIRFLNEDGSELQTQLVEEGTVPAYTGEALLKEGYAFVGWDPEIVAASADADYTAVFTAVAPASEEPEPSEEPQQPKEPEVTEGSEQPKENETKQFTITFMNYDGTVLEEVIVNEGETPAYSGEEPVHPENETYIYKFAGWDSNYDLEYDPAVDRIVPAIEDTAYIAAYLYAYNPNAIMTAATLSGVSNLSYESENLNWKASFSASANGANGLTAVATGANLYGYLKTTGKGSVTFTNNMSTKAVLSMDCTISGDLGNVSSTGLTTLNSSKASAHYDITLAAGASVTFTITSADGGKITAQFTNIKLLADTGSTITTTFAAPNMGSYTVNDGTTTHTVSAGSAALQLSKSPNTVYTITAVPGNGNKLLGWFEVGADKDTYFTGDTTFTKTYDKPTTIKPVIVTNDTPIFKRGNEFFTDLDDAYNAGNISSKQITLVSDGIISDASYTIANGYTLLIPYEATYTAKGKNVEAVQCPSGSGSKYTAKLFKKLTVAPNTVINVESGGVIEVGASHYCSHGGTFNGGTPNAGYGQIQMGSGAKIELKSNATLYAWGYITGSGSVIANSGAKVYEKMQVTDYHGGSFTSEITGDYSVFPFNQYYIQNVEVPMTVHAGATLICDAAIYAYKIQQHTVDFMGSGNSSAMFTLSEGSSVTKTYDAATDRLILDVNGSISMNPIEILGEDTREFVLPFNQNITINIHSGRTTVNQDIMMEPGAQINVDEGATLYLPSGKNFYLMDQAAWKTGNFCFKAKTRPLLFVGSKAGAPVVRTMTDAKVDVNGTVIIDGSLYATSEAVKITSSRKTGSIVYNSKAPGTGNVDQCDVTSGNVVEVKIPVASVYLTNGDGTTPVNTTGTAAGTTYYYCATHNCWYTGECEKCAVYYTVSFDADGGSGTMAPVNVKGGTTYTLPTCTFTREGYKFERWNLGPEGFEVTINADTDLKAVWTKICEVTWKNGSVVLYIEDVEAETVPSGRQDKTPTKDPDANGHYTFAGWSLSEGGAKLDNIPAVTEDTTFYAIYTRIEHSEDRKENVKDPTCTEAGYTGDVYCKCGVKIATGTTVPNTGHNFDNGDCVCGEKKPGLKGDVNLDGEVDANDMTVLARHMAGIEVLTGQALENADVDGNGEDNAEDLTVHARYLAGIITDWP